MVGYILVGTLAAMGLLSVLWVCFGWLLPGGKGAALVCVGWPEEGMIARCRWLRELGLLHCPMIVVSDKYIPDEMQLYGCSVEFCGPEMLISRLEQERERCDRTGNGDPAGRGQRCGISEL